LVLWGFKPGPMFIEDSPAMFWGLVASMYIGNMMLLVLNLPLVGLFASLTKVPAKILIPVVTAIMFIGAYSLNNSLFDIFMLLFFGVLGFIFKYLGYSATPLLVGLVLGPVFEKSLRQGLIMADGNFMFFLQRPISGSAGGRGAYCCLDYL
ncbi:MAG: tripartite tricarboxylate transporter permease, partial [Deltaproteobacteria bacterium]|nr:tripartite tricarboxylate transporter permease [Deltaproteobacteria bacterium]